MCYWFGSNGVEAEFTDEAMLADAQGAALIYRTPFIAPQDARAAQGMLLPHLHVL